MRRTWIPAFTLFTLLSLVLGAIGLRAPIASAVEQGTISASATWAPGQKPAEVVEVCYVVTSDADGTNVLDRECTSDSTYTATLGQGTTTLATGTTYYVWEDVGAGWTASEGNPVEVKIPSSSGTAEVSFENEQSNGTATITIHKATCPETTKDLYKDCHDDRVPDVHFTMGSARVTTDKDGVATANVPSGTVRITEGETNFNEDATAGAAYVFCSVQPGKSEVLHDAVANHRSVDITVKDGTTVVCDWYNLTSEGGTQTAVLELHKRVCPNGPPTGDIFQECHDNLPQQPVAFSVNGGAAKFVGEDGNVIFEGLTPGTQNAQETVGPPLEFVELRIWCSVQGSDQAPFQVQPNGPNFAVPVAAGEHVICDVYNISINQSGETPTPPPVQTPTTPPVPTPTTPVVNTPTAAPPSTNTPTIAPPPTNTPTVPPPPTETPTPAPPTATATMTETPVPPTPTPIPEERPIQVLEGTCNDLSDQPGFDLNALTTPDGTVHGSARATVAEASYTVINISLNELLSSDHSITVRKNAESNNTIVACGEIGGPTRSDGSIVVGLRELGNSGLTGVAYLIATGNRTGISVFLAPGLAEEDPTLKPASDEALVIDSTVDNGPVAPESQEGYEIKIFGSGRAEITVTPPGASDALGDNTTAEKQTRTVELTDAELSQMLQDLQDSGYFRLIQAKDINPASQTEGGPASLLKVSLVDGDWSVDGNGLTDTQAATLEKAQKIVSDAVGGVELP
jgi:hypothetical protein